MVLHGIEGEGGRVIKNGTLRVQVLVIRNCVRYKITYTKSSKFLAWLTFLWI
jgi:hypothetical protein